MKVEANSEFLSQWTTAFGKVFNWPISEKNYAVTLKELASLREPIDEFFDKVLVMAKEPDVQRNRLALLKELRQLFCNVADFSLLSTI